MNGKIFIYALLLLALASCSDDDTSPQGSYGSGIFIVNEGNFGSGNGTISFLANDESMVQDGIFEQTNDFQLGDVVQSMYIDGGEAYVTVNGSNKVEIVDYQTFVSISTISDELANPRYTVVDNGIAYISNWGNFDENFSLDQSYIAVFNLASNSLITKINTEDGAEQMLLVDGILYVSNSFTKIVTAIDLQSYEIVGLTEVGQGPGEIILDRNDNLWVICAGTFGASDGSLICINQQDYSIERREALELNPSSKMAYNRSENQLYYFADKSVYKFDPATQADPENSPFLVNENASTLYSIGFDSGTIYLGDARGFTGKGTVFTYNLLGEAMSEWTVGIAPTDFVATP